MAEKKNIFETAANHLGHKKKDLKASKLQSKHVQKNYRDPEIEEMMKKITYMKEDLNDKIESLKKKTGPGADRLRKILEDPSNFSPKEWDDIQLAKKLLGDKLYGIIGKPAEKPVEKPVEEKIQSRPSTRKAKTLGSRKKWIPMR